MIPFHALIIGKCFSAVTPVCQAPAIYRFNWLVTAAQGPSTALYVKRLTIVEICPPDPWQLNSPGPYSCSGVSKGKAPNSRFYSLVADVWTARFPGGVL